MLLVSIHDVTPALEFSVKTLWRYCAEHEITPALLVVPNWHGEWPLGAHPGFVAWLRQCAAGGAEVILHGARHDEQGLPRSWRDARRAWGRTAREGEFLTLSREAAFDRIWDGLATLRELDLAPLGFVPPAWLMREEAHLAVRDAGLRFSEDEQTVRVFPSGQRFRAPAVRWSGRTPLRAHASAWVADGRWMLQRSERLIRLALHPQDLEHPATECSVLEALDRWPAVHPPTRYAALLD
jgi:uncharacterized protein